ncbi:hypothetical protein PtA15_5A839 [Puccinia triticina]|uniref:Uncharacterized protein n=1 Tax=Puccinia triticina TaxID=208348 RepID=A0ABY7CJH2_9BASI|nr:uncharacterized protein PtA15_5A839 [Puccinia triticina]WAQ85264.1 hypothetical protein PtA15_5A839 [Puccinia triticina]
MIPTSQNSGYTQGRATQTASHPIPPNHIDLSEDPDSPDDNPTAGYYIQPNYPSVEYIDNLLLNQNLSEPNFRNSTELFILFYSTAAKPQAQAPTRMPSSTTAGSSDQPTSQL